MAATRSPTDASEVDEPGDAGLATVRISDSRFGTVRREHRDSGELGEERLDLTIRVGADRVEQDQIGWFRLRTP
jgi:hypothetical protein